MNNKEIREQRMKFLFKESAKNIIKGEGLKALSVRNVAQDAGCSYATLYNYFSDLNELIFECLRDFSVEITEFVCESTRNSWNAKEALKGRTIAFAKYYVQYPGIFNIFFANCTNRGLAGDIGLLTEQTYEAVFSRNIEDLSEDKEEQDKLKMLHKNTLYGMLLNYLNRRAPKEYNQFKGALEKFTDYIL